MSIIEYYDANAVAEESFAQRYTCRDESTLCDCGEPAEEGFVYCRQHLDEIDFAMRNARKQLEDTGFLEEDAEQAMVYWLENTGEFEDRETVKKYKELRKTEDTIGEM